MLNSIVITVTIHYSHGIGKSTDYSLLLLCNWYSCYSLRQNYQLITLFNPRTFRAATILLLILVQLNSTRYHSCYY